MSEKKTKKAIPSNAFVTHSDSVHFNKEMLKICDHVEDLMTKFGARYALVAWLYSDRQLKTCASMNLGLTLRGGMQTILTTFVSKAENLYRKKIFSMLPVRTRTIWGSGSCDSSRENNKGWWNKKRSIHGKFRDLGNIGYRFPSIIVVGGMKSSLMHWFPYDDVDLSRLAKSLADLYYLSGAQLEDRGIPRNPPTRVNLAYRNCSRHSRLDGNAINATDVYSHPDYGGELRGGAEEHHLRGTVAWYSYQLSSINSVPVTPLFKPEHSYHWAAMDARPYGSGLTLHHNMFVEVELSVQPNGNLACSCEVFRHCIRDPCCVHVEYVRLNLRKLQNMPFGEWGEVVPLYKTGQEVVGYYVDGCFVRHQAHKGYRCDTDQSYSCRHVYKVCGKFGLDCGPASRQEAKSETEDEGSEDGDIIKCMSYDGWVTKHDSQLYINYPFEESMIDKMETLACHGFGKDLECPTLWCGNILVPKTPECMCECGLPYTELHLEEEGKAVTVFLNMPHYAKEMRCMKLYCPSRNRACTRHCIGLDDGLFRISKTKAVELHMLVDAALSFIRFGGVSLTAQCHRLRDIYSSAKVRGKTEVEFLEVNAFRSAVIDVASRIRLDFKDVQKSVATSEQLQGSSGFNMIICPICREKPDVVIMDGTSMTIKSSLYHAPTFTYARGNVTIKRLHTSLDRSFFNVGKFNDLLRTKRDRRRMVKLLKEFEKWVAPSNHPKSDFWLIEELKGLAVLWNFHGFVDWVYKACSLVHFSYKNRERIQGVLHELHTMSPTTCYLSYESAIKLSPCLGDCLVSGSVLECMGPFIRGLLHVVKDPTENFTRIPDSWQPFLTELVARSLSIHDIGEKEVEEELGARIKYPRPPSVLTKDFMESGICCGVSRVRHRPLYECDKMQNEREYTDKDKLPCKHNFYAPGKRTGGVFTCMCQHGVAYASFIIKEAEGRNEPFTFLTCYLEEAPRIVIYDFACSLMDYCLNRSPNYFKGTLFFVDVFHWVNHVACAKSFSIRAYSEYKDIAIRTQNSEACKQINAAMKRLRFVLSRMGQRPFMIFLRLFLADWNIKKLRKIVRLQKHGDLARLQHD